MLGLRLASDSYHDPTEEPELSDVAPAKPDQGQGHEPKTINIIINSRPRSVPEKDITFDELVRLAFDNPPTGENIYFTITYQRGQGNKPEGTLLEGETVRLHEGMIFIVTATDRS